MGRYLGREVRVAGRSNKTSGARSHVLCKSILRSNTRHRTASEYEEISREIPAGVSQMCRLDLYILIDREDEQVTDSKQDEEEEGEDVEEDTNQDE